MAVVAGGQRLGLIVRKGLEAREGGAPLLVRQAVQADGRRRPVIAQPDDRLREGGWFYGVGELPSQSHEQRLGPVGG